MTDTERLELILTELRGVKGEVGGLKSELGELKSELGELKSEVESLKYEVGELKYEMGELKSEVGKLDNRVGKLEVEVSGLKGYVLRIDQRVTGIGLIIENEIRTNIQRVAEGHLNLVRNLQEVTKAGKEMEMMAIRVNMLETDVREIKEKLA